MACTMARHGIDDSPIYADLRAHARARNRELKQKQKYYGWRGVRPSMVGQPVYALELEAHGSIIHNTHERPHRIEKTLKTAGIVHEHDFWLDDLTAHIIHCALKLLSRNDLDEVELGSSTPIPQLISYLIATRYPDGPPLSPNARNMALNLTAKIWTKQDNFYAKDSNIWPLDVRHSRSRRFRERSSFKEEQKKRFRDNTSRRNMQYEHDYNERFLCGSLDQFESDLHRNCKRAERVYNYLCKDDPGELRHARDLFVPRVHATVFRGVQLVELDEDEGEWDEDVDYEEDTEEYPDGWEEVQFYCITHPTNSHDSCIYCEWARMKLLQSEIWMNEASQWGLGPREAPWWWGGPVWTERGTCQRDFDDDAISESPVVEMTPEQDMISVRTLSQDFVLIEGSIDWDLISQESPASDSFSFIDL